MSKEKKLPAASQSSTVGEIEKRIGYVFRDKSLLIQSLTRSSWCNEHRDGYQSNEVLEFFGDGVLSVAIISCLLTEKTQRTDKGIRTELTEGDLSVIKSRLSDKKKLSQCTARLGLEKFLRLGEGDRKLGVMEEPSVMEDLFESIIGAVYIDSGMHIETVIRVVRGMLDISDYLATGTAQSPKNLLQEYCADKKRRLPQPEYRTVSEKGPDHKKVYERGVFIAEELIATAEGKNQKQADTAAAEKALAVLMKREGKEQPAAKKAKVTSIKEQTPAKNPQPSRQAERKPQPKDEGEGLSFTPTLPTEGRTERARSFAEYLERLVGDKEIRQTKVYNTEDKPQNGSDLSPKKRKDDASPKPAQVNKKSPASGEEKNKKQSADKGKGEKQTRKVKPTAVEDKDTASAELRALAQSRGLPTPLYSDLGQIKDGGEIICRVECRFMGESCIGAAPTRLMAKNRAAEQFLRKLRSHGKPAGGAGRRTDPNPKKK